MISACCCHRRHRRRRSNPPTACLQVDRLQRRLGELHGGDYNSLRRAYTTLCQHVAALEAEAAGVGADCAALEVEPFSREVVAKEVRPDQVLGGLLRSHSPE